MDEQQQNNDVQAEADRLAQLEREADARAATRHAAKLEADAKAAAETARLDAEADARRKKAEDDARDKRRWFIEYVQDEENVLLTFMSPERRDHEYARLLSTGVRGMARTDNTADI